jgi:hypothetical protein
MSEKDSSGKYYKGFALQVPVEVPPMPYPYRPGDSAADRLRYQAEHPGGDLEEQQLIMNAEAVTAGNQSAEHVIREYNNHICQYWDNGGAKNTYGYKLPLPLGDSVAKAYKPAGNAHAPSATPKGGTAPWTLVPGTVLYTIPTPLVPDAEVSVTSASATNKEPGTVHPTTAEQAAAEAEAKAHPVIGTPYIPPGEPRPAEGEISFRPARGAGITDPTKGPQAVPGTHEPVKPTGPNPTQHQVPQGPGPAPKLPVNDPNNPGGEHKGR